MKASRQHSITDANSGSGRKGKYTCSLRGKVLVYVFSILAGLGVVGLAIYLSTRPRDKPPPPKTPAAFGSWVSPITSEQIVKNAKTFYAPLLLDPANLDTVYWVESRPSEGGRSVVCSTKNNDVNATEWTSSGFSAQTRVHEYGGGAFFVYNRTVYFSNAADQRLYKQDGPTVTPVAITENGTWMRYADGQYVPKHDRIIIVREDHSVVKKNVSKEAENTIVVINPSDGEQTVLVRGADFYSSPRVSPDGKKLCWMQWNHPDMPWDSTQLWIAELNATYSGFISGTVRQVAGSPITSTMEPRWTPENTLLYISDRTDWWNLYHMTPNGNHVNLDKRDSEIGLPHWFFGVTSYALNPLDKAMRHVATLFGGKLEILDTRVKTTRREIKTGYAYHTNVAYAEGNTVYCLASDSRKVTAIIRINLWNNKVEIVRNSSTILEDLNDKVEYSIPEEIQYATGNGETAYAYFYNPQSKNYTGLNNTLPPLLVQVHGGPTSQSDPSLELIFQYYTSRGFAVLDLNYRGSTGYGRPYRERLYYNWGITDNVDAAKGALYLADKKLVDRTKLTISGGSAGGFTALSSITFQPGVFSAATSIAGIGDLELLAKETHKFESRYPDKLIGPYPEKIDVYKERSPFNHIDKIGTPCLFIHGDLDRVVPPNQAEMMFQALKNKNVTTAFRLFQGEGHGLKKADNIRTMIDGEYYFYSKIYGFDAPGIHSNMVIFNLP